MLKKKVVLFVLLLSSLLVISACSDDEASKSENESSETEVTNLVVTGDTVSEQNGCVLASRFVAGDKIVFRMDARDPITNEQVKDATLQVHLSTGDVLDMEYGQHPPGQEDAPSFWVAAYEVTEETPTGQLDYHVTAEAGDRSGEFRPFNVAPSLLTIVAPEAVNGEAEEAEATEETEETAAAEENTEEIVTNQTVDIIATNFDFNEDTFYVKAGEEVTVNLTSEEGTHGIAISGLDVAIDDPNGTAKFTPTEPGEYKIFCSVFCGSGHADMTATLVVVA